MSLNIFKKESYREELQMKIDHYKKAILEMTGPDFDLDMIINSKNFFWTIKSLNEITYEDAQQTVKSFTYGQKEAIDGMEFELIKKYVENYIYLNSESYEALYFDHFGGFIILNVSSIFDGQIVTVYADKDGMGTLIGKQGSHINHLTASVKQKFDMEKVNKKFRYIKAKDIISE